MTFLSNKLELRPYQRECIDSIPAEGRYLIQMATGLGKTVTFSQIPRQGRMLILSHREELVKQPVKYFNEPVGLEQAKYKSKGEPVVSASVQSIVKRLDSFKKDDFDIIITDEAHHAAAPTYRKIYDYFNPRLHLGFTATPNRGDQVRLDNVYDKIIFRRDLKWGIQNGYLSNINCLRVNVGYDLSGVAKRLDDYALDQLEDAVNQDYINKAVAEAYQKYAIGQTLIFATSVKHAEDIAREIKGAVAVTGQTADRARIIERFKNHEINCLVNCMIFTEGTDIPNIETIIIARPTANTALYTQMVGRGLRLYKGKDKLTLIDCVGIAGKLCLCSAPTLLGIDMDKVPTRYQNQIEGDLFDLPPMIEKIADCPESWIRNIEKVDIWAAQQKVMTYNINFFQMPDGRLVVQLPNKTKYVIPPQDELGLCDGVPLQEAINNVYIKLEADHKEERTLWDLRRIKNGWGRTHASDKQKNIITRKFPELDTTYMTKLEASQILNRVFYR